MQDFCYDGLGPFGGCFNLADFYTGEMLEAMGESVKTNHAEMFYLDTFLMDAYPDFALSALVHEFQHMILFNQKGVQQDLDSPIWYFEMLALLAEDLIDPFIGVSSEDFLHPIQSRMPLFLIGYWYGLDTFQGNPEVVAFTYQLVYAFGAYLVRNFGGVELLMEMARNDSTGWDSVSAALAACNSGITLETVLSRYGEALIYSGDHKPEGAASYDKTVSKTINGTAYTFTGFDIWKMESGSAEYDLPAVLYGPVIHDPHFFYDFLGYRNDMYGHAPLVQSLDEWQRVSGDLTIELQKPVNPAIKMWVMVR
jgi:hypothetical protein